MELQITDLIVGYGNKTLNKPFSAQFKSGQIYAILGSNGIGKSTLLKTIAGIQKPISGTCFWGTTNLENTTALFRATQMAVVLTGRPFVADLTAAEIIALGRNPHKNWLFNETEKDRQICLKAAEVCKCSTFLNKKANELSDGQFQLLMLARAVAQDTPILLLDEPTTHLDPAKKADLLEILQYLAQFEKKLVLFSTHDIDFVFNAVNDALVCTAESFSLERIESIQNNDALNRIFSASTLHYDVESKKLKYKIKL
jgi:iron complex transport system ATP-binding protein